MDNRIATDVKNVTVNLDIRSGRLLEESPHFADVAHSIVAQLVVGSSSAGILLCPGNDHVLDQAGDLLL